jgi:hypothetical protein
MPTANGSVRHLQQQRLAEQHALGIAANIVVGIADALRALLRQQRRKRADPRTGFQLARRGRAIIENLATEFMAEHDVAGEVHRLAAREMPGQLDHVVGVLARMQVRAANAAGQRLDQHLPRGGFGLGQRIDDNLAVPENGSAHRRSPRGL